MRHPLIDAYVDRRLIAEVQKEKGLSHQEARVLVRSKILASTFTSVLDAHLPPVMVEGLGDGHIMQWIIDHQDQIAKVVGILLKLILTLV